MNIEEKIIENQKLVAYTIHRYFSFVVGDEDIYQAGMIGLWKACKSFKESKGISFSTYAVKCIYTNILQELRTRRNTQMLNCVSLDNPLSMYDYHTHLDMLGDPEDYISMVEIKEILEELPEEDKRLLQLRYEGFTYKEIGAMYGYSKSRAEQHIRRIQRKVESTCA